MTAKLTHDTSIPSGDAGTVAFLVKVSFAAVGTLSPSVEALVCVVDTDGSAWAMIELTVVDTIVPINESILFN